jgi:hypothetical protein
MQVLEALQWNWMVLTVQHLLQTLIVLLQEIYEDQQLLIV